ncbi:hypothetical protein [Dermatobacter hominis]|uniref:hypothetical protein n=1 Tax=Dermatobacter hominis TaxID=2884263 RepID=UPI001D106C72|nr:hypothetical protein [Dermatobacter hominis]UDY35954.1 hypothetical protein LH044_00085 [Dermatobacter hominis]
MASPADRPGPPTTGADGSDPDSALPPVYARVLAFASILVGGAAGGLIGYAFADIGAYGGAAVGFLTFLGAIIGAGGVAVVAVLTLRALGEWETIRRRDAEAQAGSRGARRPR